jgi:hypothetical protein
MRVTTDKRSSRSVVACLVRSRRKWEYPKPGHTWTDSGIDKNFDARQYIPPGGAGFHEAEARVAVQFVI